ncbi:Putative short-chain dehydrogenase/reductase SDR, NAD(P)-binding domain superfamily [Septoria linicola]|uniref:Short-chain dehydrogenase/reductase SDR, NAD(P)-binding domain superfamily n=1 Tax=Septoria linicola TaxID=215465 RepID=A0A9Q9ASR1_9PEZI|nr:Putative short-chain dehydrogenase/reductase SDR, NAD(P)-binding domain superfamily [Septoria linicola]
MPKTAIISGGARGIGRCLVRRFLEIGYKVYVFDIDEDELNHTVKTHLKKYSDDHLLGSSICNLRNVEEIREKVDAAAKFLGGRIDVLVNNGGIASPKWKDNQTMFNKDTVEQWQAYIETNLTAPYVVSQAVLPYMKNEQRAQDHNTSEAGPCIIHIGSFRAFQSDPNQEGYASTKAGQLGLMHSMAVSLKPFGIRVNLVAPGRIKVAHESKDGDEKGTSWSELNEEKDVADHLANRAGRPKDIADAVEFLVNAGFVTAQDITVNGGATKTK